MVRRHERKAAEGKRSSARASEWPDIRALSSRHGDAQQTKARCESAPGVADNTSQGVRISLRSRDMAPTVDRHSAYHEETRGVGTGRQSKHSLDESQRLAAREFGIGVS